MSGLKENRKRTETLEKKRLSNKSTAFNIRNIIGSKSGNTDIAENYLANRRYSKKNGEIQHNLVEVNDLLRQKTVYDNRKKYVPRSGQEMSNMHKQGDIIINNMLKSFKQEEHHLVRKFEADSFDVITYNGSVEIMGLSGNKQYFISDSNNTPVIVISVINKTLNFQNLMKLKEKYIVKYISQYINLFIQNETFFIIGANIAGSIANAIALKLWEQFPDKKIGLVAFGAPAIFDKQQIDFLKNKIKTNTFLMFYNFYSLVPAGSEHEMKLVIDPVCKINKKRNVNMVLIQETKVLDLIDDEMALFNSQNPLVVSNNKISFYNNVVEEKNILLTYWMYGSKNIFYSEDNPPESSYPKLLRIDFTNDSEEIPQYSLLEQLTSEFNFDKSKSLLPDNVIRSSGSVEPIDMSGMLDMLAEIRNPAQNTRILQSKGDNIDLNYYFGNTRDRNTKLNKIDKANFFCLIIKNHKRNGYTVQQFYDDKFIEKLTVRITNYIIPNGETKLSKFLKRMEDKGKIFTIFGLGVAGGVANLFAQELEQSYPNLKVRLLTFGAPAVIQNIEMKGNPMLERHRPEPLDIPTREESKYEDGEEINTSNLYKQIDESIAESNRVLESDFSPQQPRRPKLNDSNSNSDSDDGFTPPPLSDELIADQPNLESYDYTLPNEGFEFQQTSLSNLVDDSYNFYSIDEYKPNDRILIDPVIKIPDRKLNPKLACIYQGYGFEITNDNLLGKILDNQEESGIDGTKLSIGVNKIRDIDNFKLKYPFTKNQYSLQNNTLTIT